MKRFEFSLQTVFELRQREEDDAKRELAAKEGELRDRQKEMEEVREILKQFQLDEKTSRAGARTVNELRLSVSWRHKLKTDLVKKAQEVDEVISDINLARSKLIEATKKRKGMELLREKKFTAWQKERNRKDQAFLDELATSAHIRKKRNQ